MQKENELQQEIELLEKLAASGDVSIGGLQQKQRFINILNKQIEQKQSSLNEKQGEIDKMNQAPQEVQALFQKL
jgi:flagellar biosynthesis chaperone FliJ